MELHYFTIDKCIRRHDFLAVKSLYFDLVSGISGDMWIGALLDLGADFGALQKQLKRLGLEGYHLHAMRDTKSGIEGVKFDVHVEIAHDHDHDHGDTSGGHSHSHAQGHDAEDHDCAQDHDHSHTRNFSEIRELIRESRLSDWVKEKSLAVFQRIAAAEGKIHGKPPEEVHFHEVGAIDSIVDIVGACIALELLGKPEVFASSVVDGTGWVNCAHGRFPIPAPATLELFSARGVLLSQCDEPNELITPTGAALLCEFALSFGPLTNFTPTRIGYGLGTRDHKTRPNIVRAILGESASSSGRSVLGWVCDTIGVLETNLDDINAELLGGFMEQALAEGALDVFHTPIQMKKNRPGVLLTVLCGECDMDRFTEKLLRETTAFGVRRSICERRKLHREQRMVKTPYGEIQVKIGKFGSETVQVAPEFESCRLAAQKSGVPLKTVYSAAITNANI